MPEPTVTFEETATELAARLDECDDCLDADVVGDMLRCIVRGDSVQKIVDDFDLHVDGA